MSSNKEIKYARSATHHHAFSLVTVGYPSAHTPIRHISMTLVSSCPRRSIQTLIQCSLTPAGSSLRLELQSYLLLLNSFLCFVECWTHYNQPISKCQWFFWKFLYFFHFLTLSRPAGPARTAVLSPPLLLPFRIKNRSFQAPDLLFQIK